MGLKNENVMRSRLPGASSFSMNNTFRMFLAMGPCFVLGSQQKVQHSPSTSSLFGLDHSRSGSPAFRELIPGNVSTMLKCLITANIHGDGFLVLLQAW